MHPTWLTRTLAVALFALLVGLALPAAQARQEVPPSLEAATGENDSHDAISGPFDL